MGQAKLIAVSAQTKTIRIVSAFVVVVTSASFSESANGQSAYRIAQMKSQRMANVGISRLAQAKSPYSTAPVGMRHIQPLRRPLGARYEGVGYSASSPAQAIRNACFYGHRPIKTYAVARGRDGYYATVYYR